MTKVLRRSGWVVRLGGWVGALLLGVQAIGCTTCQQLFHCADCASVCQVTATWKNQVYFTEDSVNGGQPLAGLVGRLYLFDKEFRPLVGTGSVKVELFDERIPPAPDGKVTALERWEIDPVTLQRLVVKDRLGMGYTLFLPWDTRRPDLTQLKLKVCYKEENHAPLYNNAVVTLAKDESRPIHQASLQQNLGRMQGSDLPYPYGTMGAPMGAPSMSLGAPPTPANPPMKIPPRIPIQSQIQSKPLDATQTQPPQETLPARQLLQPSYSQESPLSQIPPTPQPFAAKTFDRPGQLQVGTNPYVVPAPLPPTTAQPINTPTGNRTPLGVELGNAAVSQPPATLSFGQNAAVQSETPLNTPSQQSILKEIYVSPPPRQ